MNRKQCIALCDNVNSLDNVRALLVEEILSHPASNKDKRGTWSYFAAKFLRWLDDGMPEETPFAIMATKGNKKLPFYAFSSLAIADCPGRGSCVDFCYSLKGWRYPAAFFRQLQNSLLIRHRPEVIAGAFQAIPRGRTVRLFVDGDFNSVKTLRQFMDLCHSRPDLRVYGYSKSWAEFLKLDQSGYVWPANYLTNASSGSRWVNTGIANAFLALPVVRGGFDAVKVDKSHIKSGAYQGKDKAGSVQYRRQVSKELKLAGGGNVFACPGNCGNCLPAGRHACGEGKMAGVTIGIGVH